MSAATEELRTIDAPAGYRFICPKTKIVISDQLGRISEAQQWVESTTTQPRVVFIFLNPIASFRCHAALLFYKRQLVSLYKQEKHDLWYQYLKTDCLEILDAVKYIGDLEIKEKDDIKVLWQNLYSDGCKCWRAIMDLLFTISLMLVIFTVVGCVVAKWYLLV